jgi:hypothetical protein
MTKQLIGRRTGIALVLLLAGTCAASMALAQGPGGGPPPFRGPGGGPRQPASAVNAPLAMLDAKLKLTTDQDTKITQIQKDFRQQRDTLMPRPGQRSADARPDRDTMMAMQAKVLTLDGAASDKVAALLTADQQKSLPGVLAELDALRADAIPPELYGDLKLTAAQETQLTTIGQAAIQARKKAQMTDAAQDGPPDPSAMRQARQQTDTKVAAVLTAAQRQTLDKFRQSHAQDGPGGPPPTDGNGPPQDGMAPPPPDGQGPPPPDGNGPPPPDGNGPPPPDGQGPPPGA